MIPSNITHPGQTLKQILCARNAFVVEIYAHIESYSSSSTSTRRDISVLLYGWLLAVGIWKLFEHSQSIVLICQNNGFKSLTQRLTLT